MLLRILDFVFSLTALLFLSPLFILVILLLKFSGEGEVFFKGARVGHNGKEFEILKFATMLKDSPNIGTGTLTVANDPRVLPVGRILRKLKINELPQLVNVLMGHMSMVGPRPQSRRNFEAYSAKVQKKIVSVRPGLTGVASLIFRDEERFLSNAKNADEFYDQQIMPYKGAIEVWFVDNLNFELYARVIGVTVLVLVFKVNPTIYKIFPGMPRHPIFVG